MPAAESSRRQTVLSVFGSVALEFRFRAAGVVVVGLVLATLASCGGSSSLRVDPTPPPSSSPGSGAARANRVIEIQRDLGVDAHYSVAALATTLAAGRPEASCVHAADDAFHRSELEVSFRDGRETPDYWSRVEAGYIAGACPDRLPAFLASLTRLGQAQIAARLAGQLGTFGTTSTSSSSSP